MIKSNGEDMQHIGADEKIAQMHKWKRTIEIVKSKIE